MLRLPVAAARHGRFLQRRDMSARIEPLLALNDGVATLARANWCCELLGLCICARSEVSLRTTTGSVPRSLGTQPISIWDRPISCLGFQFLVSC